MAEAVAPASLTASATVAKTGRPRCVDPAFLGFVPPTTVVPIVLSEGLTRDVGWVETHTIVNCLLRVKPAN